ncbi:hypothetical protein T01_8675 [Trichinella spiralis]|uniref:Uncharacterized protein n=1 Tax=Trichinella spiralis TaxID=6334 RepID=A0A0V1BYI3_TRISP|nr:hypothetical protein T01_8675 [Trichinella spiralis]
MVRHTEVSWAIEAHFYSSIATGFMETSGRSSANFHCRRYTTGHTMRQQRHQAVQGSGSAREWYTAKKRSTMSNTTPAARQATQSPFATNFA